jgi:hypothetical protein
MDGSWAVSGMRVALKRLPVFVGAVVLLDTMFVQRRGMPGARSS